MKPGFALVSLAVTLLWSVAAAALPAPKVSIASLAELPIVERAPYDVNANASAAVDAAFTRARNNGKRVLIDMGGNWCGDCIVLANLMQLPEMKSFLTAHFEIVSVDIGRYDHNLQIPTRFGALDLLKRGGVPSIIIAEPDGTFVNRTDVSALEDARHMTPQSIADWLAQWAK